jgi:hypothetical protein
MIVDDQKGIRRLLEELFKREDWKFMPQPMEGSMEKVDEFLPDILLIDMKMPNMNGLEASQKILPSILNFNNYDDRLWGDGSGKKGFGGRRQKMHNQAFQYYEFEGQCKSYVWKCIIDINKSRRGGFYGINSCTCFAIQAEQEVMQ